MEVTLYAQTEQAAIEAAEAAFQRFAQLEDVLSDYRPTSEARRLTDKPLQGPVRVSAELLFMTQKSQELYRASEGAFDITVSPIIALWREARQKQVLPTPEAIARARRFTGMRFIEVDPTAPTINVTKPWMRLDFGGIAKGYACDEALKKLKAKGIERAMVQAGGDLAVSGPPPGAKGWTIAVAGHPGLRVHLKHQAMSTSGDSEQFVEIEGTRYSHIVDPKTGYGVTSRIQATVIGPKGLETDPLATACCILGEEKGTALARQYGCRVIFKVISSR